MEAIHTQDACMDPRCLTYASEFYSASHKMNLSLI